MQLLCWALVFLIFAIIVALCRFAGTARYLFPLFLFVFFVLLFLALLISVSGGAISYGG